MSEHGHHHDQGLRGALRYLRHGPRMWNNPVNDALIDLIAPTEGETIVDIGAGMGPATVIAAERGARVVAVDPTPFMRGVLRARRLAQNARRRISVVDGAAETVPLADHTVDAVVSLNSMHHWADPRRAAAELHRILKPGGRVALVDEDFDDPAHELHDHRHQDHGHAADDRGDHGHESHEMHMVDIGAMGELLRATGFAEVDAAHANIGGQPCRRVLARVAPSSDAALHPPPPSEP